MEVMFFLIRLSNYPLMKNKLSFLPLAHALPILRRDEGAAERKLLSAHTAPCEQHRVGRHSFVVLA
jgi:hypothetical protein